MAAFNTSGPYYAKPDRCKSKCCTPKDCSGVCRCEQLERHLQAQDSASRDWNHDITFGPGPTQPELPSEFEATIAEIEPKDNCAQPPLIFRSQKRQILAQPFQAYPVTFEYGPQVNLKLGVPGRSESNDSITGLPAGYYNIDYKIYYSQGSAPTERNLMLELRINGSDYAGDLTSIL